jgi:hypothetical protein
VNGRTVHLAYLSRLVLAMAYYAGVGGALFVQSLSVKVGVMATCVLMVGPARMRWHFPCIASLFGLWLGAADYGRAYAASTWFCMTAIILSSVYIFEHVLGGADYASLSRLARPRYRARVATTGFYVFKILPELHSRLVRIVEGFRVYGSRKNAGRSRVGIIFATLAAAASAYFLQTLDIAFSHERVLARRESAAAAVAYCGGDLPLMILSGEVLVPLLVLMGLLYSWP